MSSRRGKLVYVGNLPQDVRERDIDDLFAKVGCVGLSLLCNRIHMSSHAQYGRIKYIDVKTPARPPAFAFVEFEDSRWAVGGSSSRALHTMIFSPGTQRTPYVGATATTFTAVAFVWKLRVVQGVAARPPPLPTFAAAAVATASSSRDFPNLQAGKTSRYLQDGSTAVVATAGVEARGSSSCGGCGADCLRVGACSGRAGCMRRRCWPPLDGALGLTRHPRPHRTTFARS